SNETLWVDGRTNYLPQYCDKIYFKIPKGDLNVCLQFYMNGWKGKQYKNITTSYVLEDSVAPTVKLIKGTDRWNGVSGKKHSTRVSVRFSEPVYIQAGQENAVKLSAKLNDAIGGKQISLNYVGGSGTDTLYFDFDKTTIASGENVYALYPETIVGSNYIFDFAKKEHHPVASLMDGEGEYKRIDCVYDNRTPVVESITGDGSIEAGYPQQMQTLKINTRDISDTGKLYYALSKNAVPDDSLVFNEIPIVGDHTSVQIKNDNGKIYMFAYAVSALGLSSRGSPSGELKGYVRGETVLDNVDPVIKEIKEVGEGTTRHKFAVSLDKFGGEYEAALGKVYLLYSPSIWNNTATKDTFKGEKLQVYDWQNPDTNKMFGATFNTETNVFEVSVSFANVGLTKAGWSFIGFYVEDAAGNGSEDVSYGNGRRVNFSTNESFNVDLKTERSALQNIDDAYVFEVGKAQDPSLEFWLSNKINEYDITALSVKYFKKYGANGIEEDVDFKIESQETTQKPIINPDTGESVLRDRIVVIIPLKNKDGAVLSDGCYKIAFSADYNDLSADKKITAVSNEFTFYLYNQATSDTLRETENYAKMKRENGFVSRIYTVDAEARFGYLNDVKANNCSNGSVSEVSYTANNKRLIFSSRAAAREYLIFKEYQDLALLKIDKTIKQMFADGISYKVATEDAEKATDSFGGISVREGDYWIRYKRSNWQQGSSSDWVYYYYGSGDGLLDVGKLLDASKPGDPCYGLRIAIESVVDRILNKYGKETYVYTDYYEDDTLDAYHTPRFAPEQIHPAKEIVEQTLLGAKYSGKLTYPGDSSIFSNDEVTDENRSYVSSYSFSFIENEYRRVFYRRIEDTDIYELFANDKGTYNLMDLKDSASLYEVYELTEKGFYSYFVSMDREAPVIRGMFVGKDGWTSYELDSQRDALILYTKSFTLTSISDSFDKDYSYVSVFKKSSLNASHVKTVIAAEMRSGKESIVLNENGIYTLEVSDRSGNHYTITVNVKTDDIEASYSVQENKYVRFIVGNRTDKEIENFEIRLNGAIKESAYSEDAFYLTESGTYTFLVADRYNNVYTETCEFERTVPNVSIKYRLSVSDNYTVYEAGKEDQPLVVGITDE
ncbi:MAG: hypothetical protein MJ072_00650, partial [Clostridia bacterium]|nr:hypothetical protein [Clostridia bacterium]